MYETPSGTGLAELLMHGPRGRRLLLEFAVASERLHDNGHHDDSFSAGVFWASYQLDPNKGTSVSLFGDVDAEATNVTAAQVADRLAAVVLAEVTPALLRDALFIAVGSARYWQEPDGRDVLAATDELRAALWRVAHHVAVSQHTVWWTEPVTKHSQWAVGWHGAPLPSHIPDPMAVLGAARDQVIDEERVARRDRPLDPTANFSGHWWSRPPGELVSSAGELFDGSPVKLWFVEDSLGWERATAQRLTVPEASQIYEIDSAQAWAGLCARFPLDVTAQKRHDWYRTTGRRGKWVIPDWAEVAKYYDAVHLQTRAYLCAAGTAIWVDDHTASVIAGWDPDVTYWFTPHVSYLDEPVTWVLEVHEDHAQWLSVARKADGGT